MVDDMTIEVVREKQRYAARWNGEVVGFAAFHESDGRLVFTHTETSPEYEGRGIGSALARGALDDVRARQERIVAQCPFIAAYIQRHPEYQELTT